MFFKVNISAPWPASEICPQTISKEGSITSLINRSEHLHGSMLNMCHLRTSAYRQQNMEKIVCVSLLIRTFQKRCKGNFLVEKGDASD